MSDPQLTTLISAVSAISATLITIFLTPKLQHYFWKHQRRAELRLDVINEVNKLTADFIEGYIEAEMDGRGFKPSVDFFKSFQAAAAKVKALFSERTFQAFKSMEVMIGPNLGPRSRQSLAQGPALPRHLPVKR